MHHQNFDPAGAIVLWVVMGIMACLYFLPSAVAILRRAPNTAVVIVLNVFLGWTLVGWVVSLALAVKSETPPVVVVQQPVVFQPQPPQPPPGPGGIRS